MKKITDRCSSNRTPQENSPSADLLCLGDPAELRRRAQRATGSVRRRLDHFLWVARNFEKCPGYRLQDLRVVPEGLVRPMVRPDESMYSFLAYVLTGRKEFAQMARGRLFELAGSVAEREKGEWTQMHTWCDAFPFARWLIAADWIWDSEVLSARDRAELKERLLYHLWAHPYQRLKARVIEITPCNNQNGSMAFACVVGGYLFGIKRGHHPRARQLLELGMPHLVTFLTAFPEGGYSYEGSTYMAGVNAPLIPLGVELVKTVTGVDLFEARRDARCASVRETLYAVTHLSSPSGLLHPWDNYGYSRALFTVVAAYLAFRTGDAEPLGFLNQFGAMEEPDHAGWGFDKTLWTLLWLLRGGVKLPTASAVRWSFNRAVPSLGASASGPGRRQFLFQMWDRSHWPPSRCQFNPNSIVMEYDGVPLVLDGMAVEGPKSGQFVGDAYQFIRPDYNQKANLGGGTVGAHNCVFLDDEAHYASPKTVEGRLAGWASAAEACLFDGDVTACYRPRYDVTSIRRRTLVLGDDLVLIQDRIKSATPHKVTWRVHVRNGTAETSGERFTVFTPEQIRFDICIPGGGTLEHRRFPPESSENPGFGVHEVSHHARGNDVTLHTLLVPRQALRPWLPLDRGWRWRRVANEAEAYRLLEKWDGGEAIDFSRGSWFYGTKHHEPGVGVYRCEFEAKEVPPARVWLRVPRLVRPATIRINGTEFPIERKPEETPLTPHLLEVGRALRQGSNVMEIIATSTLETAFCGTVALLTSEPEAPSSRIVPQGEKRWELHHHGRCDVVEWQANGCVVRRANGKIVRLKLALPRSNRRKSPSGSSVAFKQAQRALDRILTKILPPSAPRLSEAIVKDIESGDWRVALAALEEGLRRPDDAVVQAAWRVLQCEVKQHETLPQRNPEDVCWYRLKAAAAYVLGAARFQPAVDLLGQILLSRDIYPARVACAQALGQIGTPEALTHLRKAPDQDEINTVLMVRRWRKM